MSGRTAAGAAVDVPVLVVGGGPAGMTMALLLARSGVRCRVVERRDGPQPAPAAHAVNARTFEIFRGAGVDMRAIADACQRPTDAGQVLWVTTLAGPELGRLPYERQGDELLAVTPTPLRNLSQHRLEPILAEEVRRRGDAIAFAYGHEWQRADQDADGVTSVVCDRGTGDTYTVRSRWLIAADGAASRVRGASGIAMVGPDRLQSFVMIHFEADLRPLVGARPAILYWTTAPDAIGTFVAHDIDATWVYMHPWDPDRESAADYTEATCADVVRRALGTDAYPFAVRTIRTWTMTAQVAERYCDRRIFLVGDAAHRFPPSGGLGLNTGVQDAHNLAWKIAAVEAAWAPATLLDSYERERRPVAQRNAEASLQNAFRLGEVYQALAATREAEDASARPAEITVDHAAKGAEGLLASRLENVVAGAGAAPDGGATRRGTAALSTGATAIAAAIANQAEHFDMLGLHLGFAYDEGALVAEPGASRPGSVREYVPNALPGARVPHAWVTRAGARVSSLDCLPYDRFTLIAGPASPYAHASVASAVSGDHRRRATPPACGPAVPLDLLVIGRDVGDADGTWTRLLGIAAGGAVLVRPDQHVAWRVVRATDEDAAGELSRVLATIVAGGERGLSHQAPGGCDAAAANT